MNEGKRAFDCATDIAAKRVLQLASTGNVSHNSATATNAIVGVSDFAAVSGDNVGVHLLNRGGTVEVEASGAIALGDYVAADAAGKVQTLDSIAAGTYARIGMAIEAATADGDVIEIMLDPAATTVIVS